MISVSCGILVVVSNPGGTTCGPKSLDRSMSVRGALCKRPYRSRVGGDRALYAGSQALGPPAGDRLARGAGCDPVYCAQRMPVAHAAEGLSAVHDGAGVFLRLAGQRPVRADQL